MPERTASTEPTPSGGARSQTNPNNGAGTPTSDPPVARQRSAWILGLGAAGVLGLIVSMLLLSASGRWPHRARAPQPAGSVAAAPPAPPRAPADEKVNVTVRSDVRRGELWVDGESHGIANTKQWTFDVEAGSHELAIHTNGKAVVSKTITARAGKPLNVFLMLPEGPVQPRVAKAKKSDAVEADPQVEADRAESLSAAQLTGVVESNKPQLKRCYEGALRATGGRHEGPIKVSVSVAVGANGDTQQVTTEGDELGEMHSCIKSAVQRWRYPPSSADVAFAFPLVFQQSQ